MVCAVLLVFNGLVLAAPVGKITRLEGRVDVLKAGQKAVAGVSLGDNVDVGDIYRAKTNSGAEITFFNKNILRIYPATRVQISQYSDDGKRSNQIMKMDRGRVDAISSEDFVRKVSSFAEGNKFEVHTPNAVAGIRGSGMGVRHAQVVSALHFFKGHGYFYNPNQPAMVRFVSAGFVSFIVGMSGMPSLPVPGGIAYIGGAGGAAPGLGDGTGGTGTGLNLNFQMLGVTNPIDQTLTTTPPPQVPNVMVGSVSAMTGTASNFYGQVWASLNNVKFYGPSMTGVPTTWQADSFTGHDVWAANTPAGGGVKWVNISGGGMTAALVQTGKTSTGPNTGNFTLNVVNGNAPNGVGSYTQAFTFSGTVSGTWTDTVVGNTVQGSFTGTASGVVPSVLTMQEPVQIVTIYVGSIPYLSGSAPGLQIPSLMLNDVKFYGPSNTSIPQSWVAGSVTGSAGSTVSAGTITMTGPNVTAASVVVNSAFSQSFTGTVSGTASQITGGPYTGKPVNFYGTISTTFPMGGGPIAGNASGTASP